MKHLNVDCNDIFPTDQSVILFNEKFGMVDAETEVDELLEEETDTKTLVEIEDFFGSDFIYQLPNGHIIMTERNGGGHTMSSEPVDKSEVIKYINDLTDYDV